MRTDRFFYLESREPAEREAHLRDLIEQVLFTAPGERVNRPQFGAGLQQLIFVGNSEPLATATNFLVQSALQHWLGELIEVGEVLVEHVEATLTITVRYTVRRTGEAQVAEYAWRV